jgi:hypothetical protein
MDSVHRAVDCGATGPPWTGGHCRVRELTGARPPAAPVPESSGQAAGEGKEADELNGEVTASREVVEGVSPLASGSAMAVELRSGGNERGRILGRCEGGGCSDAFYRVEGRSGGGRPLKGRR